MNVEIIPSAKRLIKSLRDVGYDFEDAVADIIDNSVEARATVVNISLVFDGENSYLTISDNGVGLSSKEIQEAMRFGSNRKYADDDDLGRFGLGLKTASLSQCERLTVSSRQGEERARINSFCWDLNHIEKTNRWEILKIEKDALKSEVLNSLSDTTGTVITWERLDRLMGYRYPSGEYAKKQSEQMIAALRSHLGMVFHRFLAGEVSNKRISIFINDERVHAWDPFSRGEIHTLKLEEISIPIDFKEGIYNVKLKPYILPPQSQYSTSKAHAMASGPNKWNKQQGLYIYRANRIIQSGGWNGIRTSDEHTKLIRIALFIPHQLEELFQVNVAKKHTTLPRQLKVELASKVALIVQKAQEIYRDKFASQDKQISNFQVSKLVLDARSPIEFQNLFASIKQSVKRSKLDTKTPDFLMALYQKCDPEERLALMRILKKYSHTV